jgi:hypothetical protein
MSEKQLSFAEMKIVDLLWENVKYSASLLSMCNVYKFLLLQCFAKTRTAFLLNEAVNFCELFKKKN